MNILLLTTHFNTGGITSYLLTLSKGFQKEGHRVFVASGGGNRIEALTELGISHSTLNIQTKSELNPRIYFALIPLVRLIKDKKIDVIHSQTRITQVMGTLLEKMTGAAYVSTCHGFFKPRLTRKVLGCWGRAVVAISPQVENHLIADLKVSKEKVFLILNGLDLNDFPMIDEPMRKAARIHHRLSASPVIGIIARLSEVKGHDVLICAMKSVSERFPSALLLIVGEGKLEESLKKRVGELGLQDHVRFYPIVNRTFEMLSLFDVFVMPSLQEGLGLSVMEAQAAGVPVVASRVGGILSLIEDGKTGRLVAPQDAQELARAIIGLLENRAAAQGMGQAAREFIAKNFSSRTMVEKTLEMYRTVQETLYPVSIPGMRASIRKGL